MTINPGAIRFNTDSMKLEIFRGSANYEGTASMAGIGTLAAGQWEEIEATSPDVQTGGTRGLVGGGYVTPSPGKRNDIDYFNISSTGDSIDFGTLSESRYWIASLASRTRGVWGGGGVHPGSPNKSDTIDYVTIASTGNATDFGNLVEARFGMGGCSNSTRGLFCGGYRPSPNTDMVNFIDYITIASSGVDAQDFGDLTVGRQYMTATASSTRGLFLTGRTGTNPWTYYNTIDYASISTQGNAADFGDLTTTAASGAATSNSIRAICTGDENAARNTIEYVTIATLGNAQDFGDLNTASIFAPGAASSPTRGVIVGGYINPTQVDNMQYVQIMSTGNAIDFGNLTTAIYSLGGCSNGHGGL